MIRSTPRLTVLIMVALAILGTSGLIAAFAQAAAKEQEEEEEEQVQDQQEQGDNPPNPT